MEKGEIICPRCGSNQITANQKGFGAGKALVGAALTGGIGLLAGTLGSKKITITCLACGKRFKPGEGKKFHDANEVEAGTIETIKMRGKRAAVRYYMNNTGTDVWRADSYVKNLIRSKGLIPARGGCALTLVLTILLLASFLLCQRFF